MKLKSDWTKQEESKVKSRENSIQKNLFINFYFYFKHIYPRLEAFHSYYFLSKEYASFAAKKILKIKFCEL